MSAHIERGLLLLQQRRYDMAEKELRLGIAEDPESPQGHWFLSQTLAALDRKDEGLAEAREGIRLAPDNAISHYYHALALDGMDRLDEAEAAIGEAIRLEPEDADLHCLHASLLLQQRRWPEGLAAAEEGLSIDPEHIDCLNMRAVALRSLGRKDEASAAAEGALTLDPENPRLHASQGWNRLHANDPKAALEHFRTALRLEPDLEYARSGLVEALKARHLVYRVLLQYFLWMSRLGGKSRVLFVIGLFVAFKYLGTVARNSPEWRPILYPLIGLYVVFCILTWVAEPMFNLLLRTSKFGRYALSREELTGANWFGGFLAAAILLAGVGLASGLWQVALLGGWCALMLQPVAISLNSGPKKKWRLVAGAAVLGAIGLLAWGLHVTENAGAATPTGLFMIGWMLFPCLPLWGR